MTNPNNAIGTNGAFGGRTSVNAFNDNLSAWTRGVMSGWACEPDSGMTVALGGDPDVRDVAIAEDDAGNRTTINNISLAPVKVTIPGAPASNTRIDSIVAYVDNPPQGSATITDNYESCGIIVVSGTPSSSPVPPNDSTIRSAITADGATGATAYYVVLANISVANGTTDITSGEIMTGDVAQLSGTGVVTANNIDFTTIGTTLYSGDSQCPITLSDSAGNYEKLVIEYRCNNQTHASVDVYSPNNKDVLLSTGYNDKDAGFFLKTQNVIISDTTIDQAPNTYARQIGVNGSTVSSSVENRIWITKVTGYKSRI
jgi:hypothetical protein